MCRDNHGRFLATFQTLNMRDSKSCLASGLLYSSSLDCFGKVGLVRIVGFAIELANRRITTSILLLVTRGAVRLLLLHHCRIACFPEA